MQGFYFTLSQFQCLAMFQGIYTSSSHFLCSVNCMLYCICLIHSQLLHFNIYHCFVYDVFVVADKSNAI